MNWKKVKGFLAFLGSCLFCAALIIGVLGTCCLVIMSILDAIFWHHIPLPDGETPLSRIIMESAWLAGLTLYLIISIRRERKKPLVYIGKNLKFTFFLRNPLFDD